LKHCSFTRLCSNICKVWWALQ